MPDADHRELIEGARRDHEANDYGECMTCVEPDGADGTYQHITPAKFPCLPVRLAAALEQETTENERLIGKLRAREIRRCDICGHSLGRVPYGR